MTLHNVLIDAKKLIENPENWVKHDGRSGGAWCAASCCSEAVGIFHDIPISALRDALEDALPAGWRSVPYYNDHPATTHADIMALFDRAIANAEQADA